MQVWLERMTIAKNIESKSFPSVEAMLVDYHPEAPVYCLRKKRIQRNARHFVNNFPGKVLYAVKCNPHPWVLDACHVGGISDFDVASLEEVKLIRERYNNSTPYFQHPVKSRSAIRNSYRLHGVRHFAVDHLSELSKVVDEVDDTRGVTVYVRLATPPGGASEHFSDKFGASIDEAVSLLNRVRNTGFKCALSFHVGSQCYDPCSYQTALSVVGKTISRARVPITALDVGGGFPASYPNMALPPLADFMKAIVEGVAAIGLGHEITLLCEPGRALVADGVSVVTKVYLRKGERLYINDGIFGSFAESSFNQFQLPARLVRLDGPIGNGLKPFTVFGPTCDSNDQLPQPVCLPEDICEGDWIEFSLLGAYSNALSTNFNGFCGCMFVDIDDT